MDMDRVNTLVEWATYYSATLHPSVEVHSDAHGLSLRVKPCCPPVEALETIVSLPSSLMLSYVNAVHPKPVFGQRVTGQTPPHVLGRLVLVREYLRGPESFWAPYIAALPGPDEEGWRLPPFWAEEEGGLLEGTNVAVGMRRVREDVEREYDAVKRLLSSTSDDEDGQDGEGVGEDGDEDGQGLKWFDKALTKTLYEWAYCIFSSRSFRPSLVLPAEKLALIPASVSPDDFSVLLPLFDIGNHDMTADARWELHGRACELSIARRHEPGAQVFNNYGLKTNAELLLGYGFVLPATAEAHNDYVHVRKRQTHGKDGKDEEWLISRRPMGDASSVLAQKRAGLHNLSSGLPCFGHVQHDMVWDILCVMVPDEDEREGLGLRREEVFQGSVAGEGREVWEQVVAVVRGKVVQELERLRETETEGKVQGGLSRNQSVAREYREGCRRVLEETLASMGGM